MCHFKVFNIKTRSISFLEGLTRQIEATTTFLTGYETVSDYHRCLTRPSAKMSAISIQLFFFSGWTPLEIGWNKPVFAFSQAKLLWVRGGDFYSDNFYFWCHILWLCQWKHYRLCSQRPPMSTQYQSSL